MNHERSCDCEHESTNVTGRFASRCRVTPGTVTLAHSFLTSAQVESVVAFVLGPSPEKVAGLSKRAVGRSFQFVTIQIWKANKSGKDWAGRFCTKIGWRNVRDDHYLDGHSSSRKDRRKDIVFETIYSPSPGDICADIVDLERRPLRDCADKLHLNFKLRSN